MSTETRWILGVQPVREAIAAHGDQLLRVLVETRSEAAPQLDAQPHPVRVVGVERPECARDEGVSREVCRPCLAPRPPGQTDHFEKGIAC